MKTTINLYFFCFCLIFGLSGLVASDTHADVANYSLDNIILDDGTQMTGAFSWVFNVGDFENGAGEFSELSIPWTIHNQDDLDATFDIGSSIEITLPTNTHDDGVDITLFLVQPLTPTSSSSIDLVRSKYEIGGNGFHTGIFVNGQVSAITSIPEPAAAWLALSGLAGIGLLRRKRRR